MELFKLKKHSVKEAVFLQNYEMEKCNPIDVTVKGNVSIQKKDECEVAFVKLICNIGKREERLYLKLETLSVFELNGEQDDVAKEELVKNSCVPIALVEIKKTIKNLSIAYGIQEIDLP